MTVTRVGFVGAGFVARRHASVLATFDDVRVVGVADVSPQAAAAFGDQYGAAVYRDRDALLDGADLDALYICVPPFAHGEPEIAAVRAGLPFFVEKPVALDLPTAESVAAAVDDRGMVTAVGYHWRYLDTLDRARELTAGNPVRLLIGAWLDKVPPVGWWLRREHSGGQTIEQATHVLDVARALMGEVEEVYLPDPPGFDSDRVDASAEAYVAGHVANRAVAARAALPPPQRRISGARPFPRSAPCGPRRTPGAPR